MTDLLELLTQTKQQEGMTVAEIAEQMGMPDTTHSRTKVRKMLKKQIQAGKVDVRQGQREHMTGAMGAVWVYRRVA